MIGMSLDLFMRFNYIKRREVVSVCSVERCMGFVWGRIEKNGSR
jgi:hypothetical protein